MFWISFPRSVLIEWFPIHCQDKLPPLNKILGGSRGRPVEEGERKRQVLIWDFSQTDTQVSILRPWGCVTSHPYSHKHYPPPHPSLSCSLPLSHFPWLHSPPPPSSWSWKKFCGVAITQVFYQSFQRRKIRAIVSGWSYGQKLHTYWVHLRLWLHSLHWWAPLLENGAF